MDIVLQGVTTHNLKNIDVAFPIGQVTVVSGVSGSGKTSLVFDTLYTEAYSRYIESLSSFARQYLQVLPRPGLAAAEGLPAAIAVRQNRSKGSPRSTVGSLSELSDYLRIIFSYAGQVFCPNGHGPVVAYTPSMIWSHLIATYADERILVLAPLDHWAHLNGHVLQEQLTLQGFTRCYSGGEVKRIEECSLQQLKKSRIVVDRLRLATGQESRFEQSCLLGYKLAKGSLHIQIVSDLGENLVAEPLAFHSRHVCLQCDFQFHEPDPLLFNPHSPKGACAACQGFGRQPILDRGKLIPDVHASLATAGVACWHFGKNNPYHAKAIQAAQAIGLDPEKKFCDYGRADWDFLFAGKRGTGFTGINGFFEFLDRKKYRPHYRIHAARFRTYVTCETCQGTRLNAQARAVQVAGKTLGEIELAAVTTIRSFVTELGGEVDSLRTGTSWAIRLDDAMGEVRARLDYLVEVGLGYLNLNRRVDTLSGGELQRLRMARSLGNALTGTLYCLDEPSAGLHPADCQRLIAFISKIRDQGNTVVMVEHEQSLIAAADHVIEIGPGAGKDGGQVTQVGKPRRDIKQNRNWQDVEPKMPADRPLRFLSLAGANTNNLKQVGVRFAVNGLNVVAGVSGSGKTSLIRHTLLPALESFFSLGDRKESFGWQGVSIKGASALHEFTGVQLIGQEGLGRSSRSNLGTYLGIFAEVRKIFAAQPKAEGLGLKPGAFSFNVPGGRCETCSGLGDVYEDLSFLGEVAVTCAVCQGKRFNDEVLSISYRGKNFVDVLDLTVAEAREFFFDQSKIGRLLDSVIEIGLGYVTLGQPTSSFSGGEAQRLRLLSIQKGLKPSERYVLLIDEPTTGLSDRDVAALLRQLRRFVLDGHMVVVVEHHLGVISVCDWLVELGPGAGDLGGNGVYMGPPSELKSCHESPTANIMAHLGYL